MGAGSIFEDDTEVFTNIEVLEEDYTPDTILCREAVLDEYVDVLKPIYKGRPETLHPRCGRESNDK